MIGVGAGDGRYRLCDIQAVQRVVGRIHPAPRREVLRVADGRRTEPEEVGVERDDDVGPIEVIERRRARGAALHRAVHRVPLVPLGLRERRQQRLNLIDHRRRRDRLGQQPQAAATTGSLGADRQLQGSRKRAPRLDLAPVHDRARPVGIVEPEHGCLREDVSRAEARGMFGIAFDFRRPPHVVFRKQRRTDTAERHRRREEQRPARHDFLRLPDVGHDRLGRLARACRHTRESQRGAHQLQKLTASGRIAELGGLRGKLAVHVLTELIGIRQFLEASPVGAAFEPGKSRSDIGEVHCFIRDGAFEPPARLPLSDDTPNSSSSAPRWPRCTQP
jgi:hypothetical protein